MPSIKKETAGNATVYTLRNTKGNELKVTNLGARLVSMRFRDKNFTNRFMFKDDAAAGIVLVDGGKDFADILWQGEEFIEGVKFSAEVNGKSASVIYSISNDNEISIKYEGAGIEGLSKRCGLGKNFRRKKLSRHSTRRSRNGIGNVRLRPRLPD